MQTVIIDRPLEASEEILALNRRLLKQHEVLTIDLIGEPGSGKTALVELSARQLRGERRVGTLIGAVGETQSVAQRLSQSCAQVVQLNFQHAFSLGPNHVYQALNCFDLPALDAVFIERRCRADSPPGIDLGQDKKVGLLPIEQAIEPDADAAELVRQCHVVLVNAVEREPADPAAIERMLSRLANLNPAARILEFAAFDGDHLAVWLKWLQEEILFKKVEALMMK